MLVNRIVTIREEARGAAGAALLSMGLSAAPAAADEGATARGGRPLKVSNGPSSEAMPALRALDRRIAVDLVAHLQTLPKQ